MSYNGYTSWNAWNVSLWINSDESAYKYARHVVKFYGTVKGANILANHYAGQETPDGAKYNITAIRQALRGIL